METRSSKRNKLLNGENKGKQIIDRISNLPDAILHHILFPLPIKSIAQTSVLSKRWKYLWSTFPDLDFTTVNPTYDSSTSLDLYSDYSPVANGMDFISQVLSLRAKLSDIRIFRLLARDMSFSLLNALIRRAVRQNVQELDIQVDTDDYFNLPRCIITCESLRVFKLKSNHPGFRLLPSSIMMGGFQLLHTLSLSYVILDNQPSLLDLFTDSSFPLLKKLNLNTCYGLEYLDVSCRALEDLTLERCFQLHGLEISGAKLERLRVASCFDKYSDKSWVKINAPRLRIILWECNSITENSSLENLTSLHEASVGFSALHKDGCAVKLWSVSNLLAGLSHAHSLTFESQSVEILSSNNYFAVPLNPFNNLKSLELHTGFHENNFPGLACLFRSSPTLRTLTLRIISDFKIEWRQRRNKDLWEMSSSEEEQYWESQSQALKSFLHHLKVVTIHGFFECKNDISLAKFLLKHGRALQEMNLHCSGVLYNSRESRQREKIRSQMMGFSRASSNAKISFH